MRLSDYENEEAIELLADILEPASKIMSDKKIEALFKKKAMPMEIVTEVLKNHKKETVEVVAALHRENPKDYKFTVVTLVNDVLDILNDPELTKVFSLQGQMQESQPSGSATENTEAKEK